MDTASVSQSTLSKRPRLKPATYGLRDLAALLDRSYTSIHELAQAGALPVRAFKVGREWRFAKSEVDQLLGIGGDPEPIDAGEDDAA